MSNGKKMISIDLKTLEGVTILKKLCSKADVLLDTFRPGVMEKLGLGPSTLIADNPQLIYARLSGYGQNGHYAQKAGHDINYVGMSGLLSLLGSNNQTPIPPINIIADFGGGSFTCVLGILLALIERTKSNKGQVIDVSMVEGAAYLASWIFKSRKLPIWFGEPGSNILDGGFHFYRVYKTKDKKYMAVGAIEPQFYSQLLDGLQLSKEEYGQYSNVEKSKKKFEEVFLTKTQEQWSEIFDKLDACVTPVLDLNSVMEHPHNQSRKSFYKDIEGCIIPEPVPKLSLAPGSSVDRLPQPAPGQDTIQILNELGYTKTEIDRLINTGCVYATIKANL